MNLIFSGRRRVALPFVLATLKGKQPLSQDSRLDHKPPLSRCQLVLVLNSLNRCFPGDQGYFGHPGLVFLFHQVNSPGVIREQCPPRKDLGLNLFGRNLSSMVVSLLDSAQGG